MTGDSPNAFGWYGWAYMWGWFVVVALAACGTRSDPAQGEKSAGSASPALPIPTPAIELPPPTDRITRLVGTRHGACIVRVSGYVDCWGGLSTDVAGRIARVAELDDVVELGIDDFMRCYRTRRNVVYDANHDRGLEPSHGRGLERLPVKGLDDIVELATGTPRCALLTKGRVACWDPLSLAAKPVTTLHDIVRVVAGNGTIITLDTPAAVPGL